MHCPQALAFGETHHGALYYLDDFNFHIPVLQRLHTEERIMTATPLHKLSATEVAKLTRSGKLSVEA